MVSRPCFTFGFTAWFRVVARGGGGGGTHRDLTLQEVVAKRQRFVAQLERLGASTINISFLTTNDQAVQPALSKSSLVFTCTPSTQPLFSPTDLGSTRTHICAVGSYTRDMCELPAAVVRSADVVMVDSVDACAAEAGCLIQAFPETHELKRSCTELCHFLPTTEMGSEAFLAELQQGAGAQRCRTQWEGVSVFKSVGVGLQDVEITKLVVAVAEEMGVGSHVPF